MNLSAFLSTAFQWLAILLRSDDQTKYQTKIISRFLSDSPPPTISFLDLRIFSDVIADWLNEFEFGKALKLISIAKRYLVTIDHKIKANYSLFYFYEMRAYEGLGDQHHLRAVSRETLRFIDEIQPSNGDKLFFNVKELQPIKEYATSNLKVLEVSNAIPILQLREPLFHRKAKLPGRNDIVKLRYKDGTVKQIKYKKALQDLAQNLCTLIEN